MGRVCEIWRALSDRVVGGGGRRRPRYAWTSPRLRWTLVLLLLVSTFALNFNVLNITNETIRYYAANKDQPRAFYTNGRQFYFGVRLKL